jgi:enterochelin esterase-like enzyme
MHKHLLVAVSFCFWLSSAHAADAPSAQAGEPQSPRLLALSAALDRKDPAALADFWREVEVEHTPMVEEVPNQPHNALYTFLIQADPADDVLNVRLGADFPMRTEHHTDAFQRLGTSNVWYTSYVLPKASRIVYRIRVPQGLHRSPLSPARFTIDGVLYEHFLDPLNPRKFPDGDQYVDAPTSYYVGSEAPSNSYLKSRSEVPAGSLQQFDIDSHVLGSKRTVTMYTPAGYTSESKILPFILLFDAEPYITDVKAPRMLDNLTASGAIPPVVVAMVHTQGTRNEDLQPNAQYQQFLSAELMPWVRARYRVSKDPKLNVVMGSSFGGLAAAYTAFVHPEIFGKVFSQSGSFWWSPNYQAEVLPSPNAGWMVKQLTEAAPKPIEFFMVVGVWEGPGMVSANRILHSVLLGKGNKVFYREDIVGHNYENFQQTFPDGLITLLGNKTGRR